MDLDGNSIEVVYRNRPDVMHDGTVIEHSRVITWQRSVYESYSGGRSVVSSASKPALTEVAPKAASVAPPAPARSVSEPVIAAPQATPAATSDRGDGVSTTILGTLFGAAAGAAVAYAMVKSERDSAKKESDFMAFMDAKNIVKAAAGHLAGASSQPQQSLPAPQPAEEESAHRNIDAQSYHSATPPQPRSVCPPAQLAIDAQSYHSTTPPLRDYQPPSKAPPTYYSASEVSKVSKAQTAKPLELEYVPAASVAPSQARSRYTTARSVTSPELRTMEQARSVASTVKAPTVVPASRAPSVAHSAAPSRAQSVAHSAAPSRAQSVAHSAAPSTLISSFVADHEPRRTGEGSVHSHHSSRSKAKSSYTDASRQSSRSKHSRRDHSEAVQSSPSPPPAPPMPAPKPSRFQAKAASVVSSIFGKSSASKNDDFIDDLDIEEETEDDDLDTVVPSDSISQIGDSSSRRKHRSKKHSDGSSVISKHSSASKTSRSSRSHRSHKDSDDADDDKASMHSSASKSRRRHHRPSVVSEPSEASTVRPIKSSSRKDSVTQGQYDNLFDEVKYGTGSVAVRGITPSMISAANKNPTRTVVRHDMAQKAKIFED
jgi:hypothetical protein